MSDIWEAVADVTAIIADQKPEERGRVIAAILAAQGEGITITLGGVTPAARPAERRGPAPAFDPACEAVLAAVRSQRECSVGFLVKDTGRCLSEVKRSLAVLLAAGRVRAKGNTSQRRYWPVKS